MTTTLDLTYPAILGIFGKHLMQGRQESRAFLGWFLENFYRLDASAVGDIICDGIDDKGIDGIYVDTNLETIDVFQAKLFQNANKTLGDVALKEFAGTLSQLRDRGSIEALAASTGNVELRGLIRDVNLSGLVETGYKVRGIFVTNAALDANGTAFLDQQNDIAVRDSGHILSNWLNPLDSRPMSQKVTFHLDGLGLIEYKTPEAEAYVASLLASELVTLAGLDNQALFDWNVRQALGRTKVNRAIADSVATISEHKNFLLYHNGLTILAETVEKSDSQDRLAIDGYTVVNGCQSLSTLYENKTKISNELRLLVRIVKLPPHGELAAKITRHSNNQNSISARDLQSNSIIQKRLQIEFRSMLSGSIGYEIKRGEALNVERVITNELAAKVLLAFDLEQPWSCHQSYRYFDDLHAAIFGRPEVTASRIAALVAVYEAVESGLADLNRPLVANYSVTPFFVLYLTRAALQCDEEGKSFCQDPTPVFDEFGFAGVTDLVRPIVDDLVVDFNAELDDREQQGNSLDHKRELKSATAVRALRTQIIPSYQKAIKRKRATSFGVELEAKRNQ